MSRLRKLRRSLHCIGVSAGLVGPALPAQAHEDDEARWTPEIPKVWDDEAMSSIEVPLPSAEHSPRHVSSEYYYSIPARKIYKSYPVYHPDYEPEDYWP